LVHSSQHEEELMDQEIVQFRKAAARENRGRRDVRRRYSTTLQEQAVRYWLTRRAEGDGLRDVAAALGVAPWSLHRWTRQGKTRREFHPVQVVVPEPSRAVAHDLVVVMRPDGPRVEGLDVEAAARLLVLLR
jgi:hypothetical protein